MSRGHNDDQVSSTAKHVPSDRCVHPPIIARKAQADPAVSGESVLDAIQDTEAFVAANDQILLVVFRGTKELTDWTTNLKFILRSAPEAWGVEEGCDLHRVSTLCFTFSIVWVLVWVCFLSTAFILGVATPIDSRQLVQIGKKLLVFFGRARRLGGKG